MHAHAINAPEMQIMIMPGMGGLDLVPAFEATRRTAIRDHVLLGLREIIAREQPSSEMGYEWPELDVEVVTFPISGGSPLS